MCCVCLPLELSCIIKYLEAMRARPTLTPSIRVFEQAVWLLLECINLRRTIWGAQFRFTAGVEAIADALPLADVHVNIMSSNRKAKVEIVVRLAVFTSQIRAYQGDILRACRFNVIKLEVDPVVVVEAERSQRRSLVAEHTCGATAPDI